MRSRMLFFALLLASCSSPLAVAPAQNPSKVVVTLPTEPLVLFPDATLADRITPQPSQTTPLLAAYRAKVDAALKQPNPIVELDGQLSSAQALAQDIAVRDPRVQQLAHDPQTRQPLRMEVFGVYPLRESDRTDATAVCNPINTCLRVEMYNFAFNGATRVVVNPTNQQILDIQNQAQTQPDIPQSLTDVAIEIARNAPDVVEAMKMHPESADPVMSNTKTALNASRCERSEHLCVAPTFMHGPHGLWAIVDLTDGVLVGTRWTQLGVTGPPATEKSLQDSVVTAGFCNKTTTLERDGWAMDYIITSSDGLLITHVRYQNKPVFESVKLVDWHVSYSSKDGFGYSDAVGCPVFSQAAVIATKPPEVAALRQDGKVVGFTLTQSFWSELWPRPCNYNYEQQYQFYSDGRFRPAAASLGRGCGNDGTYRPVTRIALAGDLSAREWKDTAWQPWASEGWRLDSGAAASADGSSFQFVNQAGAGMALALGRGQFGDGGRGDSAYVYLTKHHTDRDEGDSDMMTIGPCCNNDNRQGPERFVDSPPEALNNTPLVLWYVAQMKNSDEPGKQYCWAESTAGSDGIYHVQTYPCWSGPLFTPLRATP